MGMSINRHRAVNFFAFAVDRTFDVQFVITLAAMRATSFANERWLDQSFIR